MKRSVLIVFSLFAIYTISAGEEIDLSWQKSAIQNNLHFSFLESNQEKLSVILPYQEKEYGLVISNWKKIKNSINTYFSATDRGESFLYYKPKIDKISYLRLRLQAGIDYSVISDSSYSFLHYGWQLQGRMGNKIYLFSEMWSGHFSSGAEYVRDHSILIDSWSKERDDTVYLDNIRGKLLFRGEYLDIAIGRGKYETGSNIGGSIILSDKCNDYGYMSLDLKLGDFRISTFQASLLPDSSTVLTGDDYADYEYNENKYLTIHDLSWKPSDKLRLFCGEQVIYGAHSMELSYLLPFNFIRAVEHNLSDNDNVMIYAGGEWNLWRKGILYGNVILDELKKSEILGDWWGNKYAVQLGHKYYMDNKDKVGIGLEFTAVRPWLYTHKSVFTKYSHDQIGLGFPEGSNLIQVAGSIDWLIRDNLELNCFTAFIRQGERGNNWELNYESEIDDLENEGTGWLEGNPQNRYKLQAVVSWSPLSHHKIKAGINSIIQKDKTMTEFYFSWLTRY